MGALVLSTLAASLAAAAAGDEWAGLPGCGCVEREEGYDRSFLDGARLDAPRTFACSCEPAPRLAMLPRHALGLGGLSAGPLDGGGVTLERLLRLRGPLDDRIFDVATDDRGSIYVTGHTSSLEVALDPLGGQQQMRESFDAFVAKIDAGGALRFVTYIGGEGRFDQGLALVLPDRSRVVVVGATDSSDLPVTHDAAQREHGGELDGFVALLASDDGRLLHVSYLGGAGNDAATSICRDPQGDIVAAGVTSSEDFPAGVVGALRGSSDGFLLGYDAAIGSVTKSARIAGEGGEALNGVAALDGMLVAAGTTSSADLGTAGAFQRTHAGSDDVFVARLDAADLAAGFVTYLGGQLSDRAGRHPVALAPDGSIWIVGSSGSTDFPKRNAVQTGNSGGVADAFVTRLTEDGSDVLFSTLYGGRGGDFFDGVAVVGDGVVAVGYTKPPDISAIPLGSPNHLVGFLGDALILGLCSTGSPSFAAYLGGGSDDGATSVAAPAGGRTIVTAGSTRSADLAGGVEAVEGVGLPEDDGLMATLALRGTASLPTATGTPAGEPEPTPAATLPARGSGCALRRDDARPAALALGLMIALLLRRTGLEGWVPSRTRRHVRRA